MSERAEWDRLLTDLEYRAEQARAIKPPSLLLIVGLSATFAGILVGGIAGGTIGLLYALGCFRIT